MKPIFDKNYGITSTFQDHINSGGVRAQFAGVDYGTPKGTPIYAPEAGNARMRKDQYGALYVYLDNPGVRGWYFVHLSKFNGGNRRVNAGELIGWSGNSGYSTGPHLHVGLHTGGRFVDPVPYLNNNFNSNQSKFMNTITVQPGWGLSHVAIAAGMPATEASFQKIYNLNRGHRGSIDWRSLNARMGAGDVLKVKAEAPTPPSVVDNTKEVKELNAKIEELKNESERKLAELKELQAEKEATREAEIAKLTEKLLERERIASEELESTREQLEELRRSSIQYNTLPMSDIVIEGVTSELKGRGIKAKWHGFIDKTFKSDYVRSLFKYDWFLIVAVAISAWVSLSSQYSGDNELVIGLIAFITGLGGQVMKYLVTNYDKNKDGVIDLKDSRT